MHVSLNEVLEEPIMRASDAITQGAPAESGDPQGERSGPVIDRWEPGSDFESSKPAQRAGKRKLNGVDSSTPAGRPATPQPVRSSGASPVAATGNAIGPARSDRSLDRSEPASLLLLVLCCALQGGAGAERQARFAGRRVVENTVFNHRYPRGNQCAERVDGAGQRTQLLAIH